MSAERYPIIFDVDGVLVDSLPAHLAICRSKSVEYGLDLTVPTSNDFRRRVAAGVKISPMIHFFIAVGFPKSFAERAVEDYEREFAAKYRPPLFKKVPEILNQLNRRGHVLGIVTSNTSSNVLPILGSNIRYFDQRCLFTFDHAQRSKAWCLVEAARILNRPPGHCIYVGDLPSDAIAAREADFSFVAATYGWGIDPTDTQYNRIDKIADLLEIVIRSSDTFAEQQLA